MLDSVHLVRHGEVLNPDGIVYGDLPGFSLSAAGRLQAQAAADRFATAPVDTVVSSPLQRALDTARPIAAAAGLQLHTDDRLSEWAIGLRWAGVAWVDLPTRFPGELEAYARHPDDLPFVSETLDEVAQRMHEVVIELGGRHPGGTAVLVSHQDPIQALRLRLTARELDELQVDKPTHAGVFTFMSGAVGWTEMASWTPPARSATFPPVDQVDAP